MANKVKSYSTWIWMFLLQAAWLFVAVQYYRLGSFTFLELSLPREYESQALIFLAFSFPLLFGAFPIWNFRQKKQKQQ